MQNIYDLHNDFFTHQKYNLNPKNYLNNINKSDNIACVVWTTELNCSKAINTISKAKEFTLINPNTFLAIEDLYFIDDMSLHHLIELKPVYCGLTWNYNNLLAGGALDSSKITNFGFKTIKDLEKNNITIDCAHLNESSFMDLAKTTTLPMFCSHTASHSKNAHPRNLKDYQIKIIAKSRGIVGLCLVGDFLNTHSKATINDYISHLDYLVCKFGIEHFAIGTDFCGTENLPINVTNYTTFLNLLIPALKKLGYLEEDINKLLYINAYNFFNKHQT